MNSKRTYGGARRTAFRALAFAGAAVAAATMIGVQAKAQVPPKIEAKLRAMGHIVDPACTAILYRPLMPKNDINSKVKPLYPGISIVRNARFGPNPKDAVDIFSADKGPASRPVLIYVPGGAGNKIEIQNRQANAFYDNIGRWATQHGMVEVNMQRHAGKAWDSGAKDISRMIQWVEANIRKYHGNPNRMFIWAQSAGNVPLGNYVGHPNLWGPKGVGVKGVIFMSGQFDILPLNPPSMIAPGPAGFRAAFATAGKNCGSNSPFSEAGAVIGAAPGTPGGPSKKPVRMPTGRKLSHATQMARSDLPGLEKAPVKIMLASAELDPGVHGAMSPFNQALHDALCKMGPSHCPTMLYEKNESHVSEVFAIDTADTSVSGPILKWIRSIK